MARYLSNNDSLSFNKTASSSGIEDDDDDEASAAE